MQPQNKGAAGVGIGFYHSSLYILKINNSGTWSQESLSKNTKL